MEEEPEIRIQRRQEAIQSRREELAAIQRVVEEEPVRAEPPERELAVELAPLEVDAEVRAVAVDLRSGIRRWRTSRAIRR